MRDIERIILYSDMASVATHLGLHPESATLVASIKVLADGLIKTGVKKLKPIRRDPAPPYSSWANDKFLAIVTDYAQNNRTIFDRIRDDIELSFQEKRLNRANRDRLVALMDKAETGMAKPAPQIKPERGV